MLALRLMMLPHVRIELERGWCIATVQSSAISKEYERKNWVVQSARANRTYFLKSTRAKAHFCLPGREVFDARN